MAEENDRKGGPVDETVWKKLTRLFRSGPVVRHKIASGEPERQPRGSAAAYKKEISSLYVHSLASYGQYERLSRYADYSEMEFTPEIASALDIYADEVTAKNEHGEVLAVNSKDGEIKQVLEELFYDVLNVEFNIWSWVRNLGKYGDFVLIVDANEDNGILNLLPIPINEIEREEGYDKKDPFAVRFRWLTQGNMILENWQIVHFRLLGNDNFLPYGSSLVEPARRIWRQLILIEDAMLVYRIVRSPERRVFKIDVGNIPTDQVEAFIEKVKTQLKRQQVVDPTTGRVDLRYNPLSVDEDYFIPVRGDRSSDISTLAGGQFTGDIDDVQYIQNKLFSALKIPKAYLSYEDAPGSKATLAQQDVRFARTIDRIQKIVVSELNKIAIIHLYLLGYRGDDLVNFEIRLANSSIIAEQQYLELWRTRLEIASSAQEGIFDREFVWKNIFKLSDEQIDKIREGKRFDKLEDLALEQVRLPGEDEGTEPGASQLPGGLPPGEEPPEGGGAPPAPGAPPPGGSAPLGGPPGGGGGGETLAAGVARPGPTLGESEASEEEPVEEKRNPGSENPTGAMKQLGRAMKPGENLKFHASATPSVSVGGRGHGPGRRHRPSAQDPVLKMRRQVTRPLSNALDRVAAKRRKIIGEDRVLIDWLDTSHDEEVAEVEELVSRMIGESKKIGR